MTNDRHNLNLSFFPFVTNSMFIYLILFCSRGMGFIKGLLSSTLFLGGLLEFSPRLLLSSIVLLFFSSSPLLLSSSPPLILSPLLLLSSSPLPSTPVLLYSSFSRLPFSSTPLLLLLFSNSPAHASIVCSLQLQ